MLKKMRLFCNMTAFIKTVSALLKQKQLNSIKSTNPALKSENTIQKKSGYCLKRKMLWGSPQQYT